MPDRQPLTRRTVTEGSILVLPSYPFVFFLVGAVLLAQGAGRTSSPAFDAAKWVMGWAPLDPISAWAFVFLGVGIAEFVTGSTGRRSGFKWLLVGGAGICAFWATLLFLSAASSPVVSFTGGIWVSHSAWCHLASIRSLTRDWVVKT